MTYRKATNLEFQLYQEITEPAMALIAHLHGTYDPNHPPEQVRAAINQAEGRVRHLGYKYTVNGLLMRDDPDIIETGDAQVAESACEQAWEAIDRFRWGPA